MGLDIPAFLEDGAQRALWFRTDHGDGTSTWVQVSQEGTIRVHGRFYPVTRACGHVELQWLPFMSTQFGLECFEMERLERCKQCSGSG